MILTYQKHPVLPKLGVKLGVNLLLTDFQRSWRRERDGAVYIVTRHNSLILLALRASLPHFYYISFYIILPDFGSDFG